MFFAQLLNDLSAACRNVAEDSRHLRPLDKLIDDRLRKAIRIGRKRALQNDAGHLPMASSRVFAVRLQRALAVTTAWLLNRRNSVQRTNVAETQASQMWQMKLARLADMTERIRTRIAPVGGIWHRADAGAVENYKSHAIERIVCH